MLCQSQLSQTEEMWPMCCRWQWMWTFLGDFTKRWTRGSHLWSLWLSATLSRLINYHGIIPRLFQQHLLPANVIMVIIVIIQHYCTKANFITLLCPLEMLLALLSVVRDCLIMQCPCGQTHKDVFLFGQSLVWRVFLSCKALNCLSKSRT